MGQGSWSLKTDVLMNIPRGLGHYGKLFFSRKVREHVESVLKSNFYYVINTLDSVTVPIGIRSGY